MIFIVPNLREFFFGAAYEIFIFLVFLCVMDMFLVW